MIDMFSYCMDENVYIIQWEIVKFGDRGLGFNQTAFIIR